MQSQPTRQTSRCKASMQKLFSLTSSLLTASSLSSVKPCNCQPLLMMRSGTRSSLTTTSKPTKTSMNCSWSKVYCNSSMKTTPQVSVHHRATAKCFKKAVSTSLQSIIPSLEYERYFKVYTDSETKNFTDLSRKRFFVLYNLFQLKFEGNATQKSFFEYCEIFLSEPVKDEFQEMPQMNMTA